MYYHITCISQTAGINSLHQEHRQNMDNPFHFNLIKLVVSVIE